MIFAWFSVKSMISKCVLTALTHENDGFTRKVTWNSNFHQCVDESSQVWMWNPSLARFTQVIQIPLHCSMKASLNSWNFTKFAMENLWNLVFCNYAHMWGHATIFAMKTCANSFFEQENFSKFIFGERKPVQNHFHFWEKNQGRIYFELKFYCSNWRCSQSEWIHRLHEMPKLWKKSTARLSR